MGRRGGLHFNAPRIENQGFFWYTVTMIGSVSISLEAREAMPRRPSLFWDTDPVLVDPEIHARYIIERIMDFGTDEEVRWMWKAYPREVMRRVLALPRVQVHPKSKIFWELIEG